MENLDQPKWLLESHANTLATDGEDYTIELTQFFYYTVAFNIILTMKQLCSTHGESKYLGEH